MVGAKSSSAYATSDVEIRRVRVDGKLTPCYVDLAGGEEALHLSWELVPVPGNFGSSSEVKVSAAQVRIHAGGDHDEDSFLVYDSGKLASSRTVHSINRTIALGGRADHVTSFRELFPAPPLNKIN